MLSQAQTLTGCPCMITVGLLKTKTRQQKCLRRFLWSLDDSNYIENSSAVEGWQLQCYGLKAREEKKKKKIVNCSILGFCWCCGLSYIAAGFSLKALLQSPSLQPQLARGKLDPHHHKLKMNNECTDSQLAIHWGSQPTFAPVKSPVSQSDHHAAGHLDNT